MSRFQRIVNAQKAVRELGPRQTGLYVWYQIKLRSGYLRWKTAAQHLGEEASLKLNLLHPLPEVDKLKNLLGEGGVEALLKEADEITSGLIRLFGGAPVPLVLETPGPSLHWTEYERKRAAGLPDFKLIWEPGRFAWACTLARAYQLSHDERYPQAFWRYTELFLDANPPYQGVHWVSAQEAALRLVALVFSIQLFAGSTCTTPGRLSRLAQAVAAHAERIPLTMEYGRAQNNNHLLAEALGLFTAGAALPDHRHARHWQELGWRWLNTALQTQIDEEGGYVQQSSNYHRLMLQAALWAYRLADEQGIHLPNATLQRLHAATKWLKRLLDPTSGRVPNLGPNDGAYILPLTVCPFDDYRPVLQAASQAFTRGCIFDAGPWDEIAEWICPKTARTEPGGTAIEALKPPLTAAPLRMDNPASSSWAYFRVAKFSSRPGHADQLHVDLWWHGLNIAADAGTYLYNDPPPWDNALARTAVHNTLMIDSCDQMTRAGRFLWLDWAQARLLEHELAEDGSWERITAEHNGYRRLGIRHQRSLTAHSDGRWSIEDSLAGYQSPKSPPPFFTVRLQWLLPDWPWEVEQSETSAEIFLASPQDRLALRVGYRKAVLPGEPGNHPSFILARAGELIFGSGRVEPSWGWVSNTYAHKIPALSFSLEVHEALPVQLTSEWKFPA